MTEKVAENGKSFVFTINNYTEKCVDFVKAVPCQRIIAGYEVGEEKGTPHIQGAIVFKKTMRIKAVCKALGGRASVRYMKGDWSDQSYCAKDGHILRMEDNTQQGERVDLAALRASIEKNDSDLSLYVNHASAYAKYPRYVGGYKRALAKEAAREFRDVTCEVYVGKGGTFKSRLACYKDMNTRWMDKDTFAVPESKELKWWDGYEGEKCIVIEEFDGTQCSFPRWKRIVDGNKFYIEEKFGGTYAAWTHVIICSNVHPDNWWGGLYCHETEFTRRITKITKFD
jgi:hypothetical protein